MRILAIETSCDETAVCLIGARGGIPRARLTVLGNALYSQVATHAPYGGVFPALAMREHQKNLVPLLQKIFEERAQCVDENQKNAQRKNPRTKTEQKNKTVPLLKTRSYKLKALLAREPDLLDHLLKALPVIEAAEPPDAIAVTNGPGLEPALWIGINFARALSVLWGVPVVPINHMEGHIVSALLRRDDVATSATSYQLPAPKFPALALLVSGGHTELVLMRTWLDYTVVGETRDDAAGEAFDKVARMLGLPYPGGPAISTLAEAARKKDSKSYKLKAASLSLPRPMLRTPDFDFSFSGLKTAVLYLLKGTRGHAMSRVSTAGGQHPTRGISASERSALAREFEDAVVEVLVAKTLRAAEHFGARTVLLGGGVAANTHLRRELAGSLAYKLPKTALLLPDQSLTGDNAVMIGAAAYLRATGIGLDANRVNPNLRANGNLRLGASPERTARHRPKKVRYQYNTAQFLERCVAYSVRARHARPNGFFIPDSYRPLL